MTFQTTLRGGLTWAFKWGERPKSGMVYGTNEPVQVMGSWLVLINLTRKNQVQYYFDLFSTKTDQHQFSPNNVNTKSGEKGHENYLYDHPRENALIKFPQHILRENVLRSPGGLHEE